MEDTTIRNKVLEEGGGAEASTYTLGTVRKATFNTAETC